MQITKFQRTIKILFSILLLKLTFTTNILAEIKIGIVLGFTGPVENLTPSMAESAELALKEATDSGLLLNGETISIIKADTTCTDSDAAIIATERVISEGAKAIIGAVCPEITKAILLNSVIPNKVTMISPAATSSDLTSLNDDGFFFRTTPSDTRGGEVLADITKDRKIKKVAITFTNNENEKNLADVYKKSVEAYGIEVSIMIPHEDGKEDYSSEVATLASAGGDAVVVIGYLEQGGKEIIKASLDSGAFDKFILSDGMIDQSLIDTFGKKLNKSFGFIPGSYGKRASFFNRVAAKGGINISYPYTGESYDAAALIILAIQAGASANSNSIAKNVMYVANAPGTKIYPGEIKKGLELLAKGKKIDYEGATGVSFNELGEANGSFLEQEVKNRKFRAKKQR